VGVPQRQAGGRLGWRRRKGREANESEEARAARVAVLAKAAELAKGCRLCGKFIAAGKQGYVFEHRDREDKVVKVYLEPDYAELETRAFRVLGRISEANREFRSLRAESIPGNEPALMIDRFQGTLAAYVDQFDNPNGNNPAHAVDAGHFNGLLDQFAIMHSHGVSHGDAHSGNTGLVVTADGPRFVIGDPTNIGISPLSWVSDVAAEGEAGRVLQILRERARGKLSDRMDDELDHEALLALLRLGGVDPDKEIVVRKVNRRKEVVKETQTNLRVAYGFLWDHRAVVDEMQNDFSRLMYSMRNVPGIKGPPVIARH
jgi:hypothetical protein